ncbi:MAG: cytochrome c3 family protein [Nitrospirota bacterium]
MRTYKLCCLFIFFLIISIFLNCSAFSSEENPCLTCHINLKEPAKNVHEAFRMGCETCHKKEEGKIHPDDKKSMKLVQNMPGLCYLCHESSKFGGEVIHAPLAAGMCIGCHDPHQSNNDKLLKEPLPEVCYTCHDKANFTKKYVHNVINVVGCVTCHSPHASNNPYLLPSPVNEVCITCHKAQASGAHVIALPFKRYHPVKGVKDPTTLKMIKAPDPKNPKKQIEVPDPNVPGKELSCTSCHNPHSSDYRRLYTSERLCTKCHQTY